MQNLKKLSPKLAIKPNENSTVLVEEIDNCEISLGENSRLTLVAILSKGWDETKKLNFHLNGSNSEVNFICINIGHNDDTFPFETQSIHTTQHTKGFYYLKSALFDSSKVDYTGTLIIKKAAQLTDSYLSHSTLMLSPKASAHTTPSLEIEADDVKAGHSATIGSIDDDVLFYFQSRGINKEEAQKIMIKGFLEQDLQKIEDESARKTIAEILEKLLNKHLN